MYGRFVCLKLIYLLCRYVRGKDLRQEHVYS